MSTGQQSTESLFLEIHQWHEEVSLSLGYSLVYQISAPGSRKGKASPFTKDPLSFALLLTKDILKHHRFHWPCTASETQSRESSAYTVHKTSSCKFIFKLSSAYQVSWHRPPDLGKGYPILKLESKYSPTTQDPPFSRKRPRDLLWQKT